MSRNTRHSDDEEMSIKESWQLIAEAYEGEPAGEIARVQLEAMDSTD